MVQITTRFIASGSHLTRLFQSLSLLKKLKNEFLKEKKKRLSHVNSSGLQFSEWFDYRFESFCTLFEILLLTKKTTKIEIKYNKDNKILIFHPLVTL